MYTLAPFMVLEFGVTEDRQAIGFWSGFIVAIFFLARTVTLPGWGRLADRIGRGHIIRFSLWLTGMGTLACGFATSLEAIAAARLVTGAFSAVHASCCAMGYQLSGNRGSAIVESGFSFGKLIGPGLVGWLLIVPVHGWPSKYPFLMPCGVLALMQFLVIPLVPAEVSVSVSPAQLLGGMDKAAIDVDVARENRRRAMHAQGLSAGLVVVSVAMEECFVLYGVGVLGIGASAIGTVYLVAGAVDLILQNTVLLQLIQGASTEQLARLRRLALVLYALPTVGLPFVSDFAASISTRVLLLGLICGVRTSISFVFFVSNMSLLNDASPGAIAAAQSVRMAVGSALQVIGPPLGASTYAWSATSGRAFPTDQHLVFLCAAAWSSCLALVA